MARSYAKARDSLAAPRGTRFEPFGVMRALLVVSILCFATLPSSSAAACEALCDALVTCMQDPALCPAFDDPDHFRARCNALAEDECAALSALVDPTRCEASLAQIAGVSPGFDERCGFAGSREGAGACVERCAELWTCATREACPGLTPDRESTFMETCGAIAPCDALEVLVDPSDCALTVAVMSTLHDGFGRVCDGGVSARGVGDSPFSSRGDDDVYVEGCGCAVAKPRAAHTAWLLFPLVFLARRARRPSPRRIDAALRNTR